MLLTASNVLVLWRINAQGVYADFYLSTSRALRLAKQISLLSIGMIELAKLQFMKLTILVDMVHTILKRELKIPPVASLVISVKISLLNLNS